MAQEYKQAEFVCALNGAKGRQLLGAQHFEHILISAPLLDESGIELAVYACEHTQSSVLLLVPEEHVSAVTQQTERAGVFVLGKPLHRSLFFSSLRNLNAASWRVKKLLLQTEKLQKKLEDQRIIDRAKCKLIESGMSEEQAHRHLEQTAMQQRSSKRQIAEELLG